MPFPMSRLQASAVNSKPSLRNCPSQLESSIPILNPIITTSRTTFYFPAPAARTLIPNRLIRLMRNHSRRFDPRIPIYRAPFQGIHIP